MGLIKLEMDEQKSNIQNLRCDYSHNKIAIRKKYWEKFPKKWRFSNCSNFPQNHRTENFLCSTETRGVGASIGMLT